MRDRLRAREASLGGTSPAVVSQTSMAGWAVAAVGAAALLLLIWTTAAQEPQPPAAPDATPILVEGAESTRTTQAAAWEPEGGGSLAADLLTAQGHVGAGEHEVVTVVPLSVGANFNITLRTAPVDLSMVVDGQTVSAPQVYLWENASDHLVTAPSPLEFGDERYVFSAWSDGDPADRVIRVDQDLEFVANYVREVRLTVTTSPLPVNVLVDGVMHETPVSLWVEIGTAHTLNGRGIAWLTNETRVLFNGWNEYGPQIHRIIVDGPQTHVGNFTVQHHLTIETAQGRASCDIPDCWYDEGTVASPGIAEWPAAPEGTQHVFRGWRLEPGNVTVTGQVSMDQPQKATAVWATQHGVTVDTEKGHASGGGWYDNGTVATISLEGTEVTVGGERWRFAGWEGAASSSAGRVEVTVDGPKELTARWVPVPTPGWRTTAGVSLVALVLAVAAGGLAVSRTPRAEYWLGGLSVPLFSRLAKSAVKNQYNRGRMIQYIADNPGANYSQVRRTLGMGNGGCAYHLGVLERNGEIKRVAQGPTVRFYLASYKFDAEALPPLAFVQRLILETLLELECADFGAISRALAQRGNPVRKGNLSHHLRALGPQKELISSWREGRKTIYTIEPPRRDFIARRLEQDRAIDTAMNHEAFGSLSDVPTTSGDSAGPP